MNRQTGAATLALLCLLFSACTPIPGSSEAQEAAAPNGSTPTGSGQVALREPSLPQSPGMADKALPLVTVHKGPTCSCCALWVEHMRESGFKVEVVETSDLASVKQRVGVPVGKATCHTAEVGGYFVEGHVPAEDIKRLLGSKPPAKGLVLPGMPAGSPGMEMADGSREPYTVELVHEDGRVEDFAKH